MRWEDEKGGKVACGKVEGSWFYSRLEGAEWVQHFIFLFLILISEAKEQDLFQIFLRGCRYGKTLLRCYGSC